MFAGIKMYRLTKMAEATLDISYRQMANAAQWRLHEDAMNKTQAILVNYHHKFVATLLLGRWGFSKITEVSFFDLFRIFNIPQSGAIVKDDG